MALYAGLMAVLGIDRYLTYHSGADLGVFVQSIADAAHGMRNQSEGGSHFQYHFSPLLYLCAPLLLAMHSPIALIILQACAGALTAPAIYLLARRRMDERLANMAGIVALLYPPLVGVTFTDFHENGFAPAAIAWLLWAVDSRRWRLALLFTAVALAIKEDEAYVLMVLGAGYGLFSLYHGDRKAAIFGGAVSAASAAVFVAFFSIIRPLAGASHPWVPLGFYTTHTADVAHGLTAIFGRLTFLLEVVAPLMFLPLFSRWFLLAIPGLIEVLGSRWSIAYTMGQHYAGVWISYVLGAFVLALAAIAGENQARARTLLNLSAAACALILVFASPTHWGHFLGMRTSHDVALDRTLALIPAGASVGSVDEVFVHQSLNPDARPGYAGNLEYLIVDDRYDSPTWRDVYRSQLQDQLESGAYHAIASDDGVTLYRRANPSP